MDLSGLLKTQWQPLPFSIKPSKKVNIDTLKKILREHHNSHFEKPISICNCDTLESTIVQIRLNPERILLRKALGRPCSAPYMPFYFGITQVPEGYEDIESEKALAEHFLTKPEDMDYKNNAWYRAMEIEAACDILGNEKITPKIQELEAKFEEELKPLDSQLELRLRTNPDIARAMMEGIVMSFAKDVENFTQEMKKELRIFTGEAMTLAVKGENFKVKIPALLKPEEIKECKCGTSYCDKTMWSECVKFDLENDNLILEFNSGKWLDEAVPCFTDLYIIISASNGEKFAGSVKIRVRS